MINIIMVIVNSNVIINHILGLVIINDDNDYWL